MPASLDPMGLPVATDVVPGLSPDDLTGAVYRASYAAHPPEQPAGGRSPPGVLGYSAGRPRAGARWEAAPARARRTRARGSAPAPDASQTPQEGVW